MDLYPADLGSKWLIAVVRRNVVTDVSDREALSIASAMRGLDPKSVKTDQVPYSYDKDLRCCGNVIVADENAKKALVRKFFIDAPATSPAARLAAKQIPKSSLHLDVENGSGVAGIAHRVADALDACRIPYFLSGSFASNFYGIPRSTNDADFVLQSHSAVDASFAQRLGEALALRPGDQRRDLQQLEIAHDGVGDVEVGVQAKLAEPAARSHRALEQLVPEQPVCRVERLSGAEQLLLRHHGEGDGPSRARGRRGRQARVEQEEHRVSARVRLRHHVAVDVREARALRRVLGGDHGRRRAPPEARRQ